MTNAYSFPGLVIIGLLIICTSAYIRRVPRLKQMLFSDKGGFFGIFYKASVIGMRLHWVVSLVCLFMGFYTLFVK